MEAGSWHRKCTVGFITNIICLGNWRVALAHSPHDCGCIFMYANSSNAWLFSTDCLCRLSTVLGALWRLSCLSGRSAVRVTSHNHSEKTVTLQRPWSSSGLASLWNSWMMMTMMMMMILLLSYWWSSWWGRGGGALGNVVIHLSVCLSVPFSNSGLFTRLTGIEVVMHVTTWNTFSQGQYSRLCPHQNSIGGGRGVLLSTQ